MDRIKIGQTWYIAMYHFSGSIQQEGSAKAIRVCSEKLGWPKEGCIVNEAPPTWFRARLQRQKSLQAGVKLFKSRKKAEMYLKLENVRIMPNG